MTRNVLAALAFIALIGCAALKGTAKPPPDPKTQMAVLAARIAALVEDERLAINPKAKTLAIDPELTKIAQERARDMAAKNYLAYTAPDGETSALLLIRADASWQGLLGENLAAQHYIKQSRVDVNSFAKRFLDEWVQSARHRDNLAYPAYDRTGVGAAVNGDTVFVTQLIASDMGLKSMAARNGPSKVRAYTSAVAAQKAVVKRPAPVRLRGAEDLRPATPP